MQIHHYTIHSCIDVQLIINYNKSTTINKSIAKIKHYKEHSMNGESMREY